MDVNYEDTLGKEKKKLVKYELKFSFLFGKNM